VLRTKVSVVALLAGRISVPAFAACVYKWVDTQGGIHYSDTAQPGWRRVDISPTVVDAGALQPSADASTSGKRAAECMQKRDALVGYKTSARIVERNGLGVEHEYTHEEKQKQIGRASCRERECQYV